VIRMVMIMVGVFFAFGMVVIGMLVFGFPAR
jgi:hypothetical protein